MVNRKTTFRDWLMKQKRRGDPIGDIARDIADDDCCTTNDWRSMREHIQHNHSAIGPAVDAFNAAVEEWGDDPDDDLDDA